MTKRVFCDTETRSRTDISMGTDRYTADCECFIVTYAFESGAAKLWQPWCDPIAPDDLWAAINDSATIFVAHNAAFDRLVLKRTLSIDIPIERWECTAARARAHGLPGSLEKAAVICGLPEDQQKIDGYKLIDTFCIPQRATDRFIGPDEMPIEWARFCEYALRDTEVLREIYKRLPSANYTGDNLAVWHLDQRINDRGFGFDRRLAEAAVTFLSEAKTATDARINDVSDGIIESATQSRRLLNYCRDRLHLNIESMRAAEVIDWLESDDLNPVARTLLELRLEAGKSSGSKYKRGLQVVGEGDRIRHGLSFSGAGRTGRWSGKGFQVHNLPRPSRRVFEDGKIIQTPVKAQFIDETVIPSIYSGAALNDTILYGGPNEAAAMSLRHVIVAAPGNEIMAGDFKNIESVITAWLAGETTQLNAFGAAFADPKNKALDVYRIIAGKMLGKRPEDVNDAERQMGKVAILAFGFGGGVAALVNMALAYQLDLDVLPDIVLPTASPEQLIKADRAWRRAFLRDEDYELERRVYVACDVLKQQFRIANSAIDQLRKDVDTAVKAAVAARDGSVYHVGRCKIFANNSFLVIELPSGRRLLYASPRIEKETIKDPDGGEPWISTYISYSTARGRGWMRERAWAGLFVENAVQACANDILRAAMLRVHADTLKWPGALSDFLSKLPGNARTAINLHVHDEICLDVPKGSYPKARFIEMLTQRPSWAPDLPIAVDVWINPRYGKR